MKTPILLVSTFTWLCLGCASTNRNANEFALEAALTEEHFVGAWIGYDKNASLFYRLLLEPGGGGSSVLIMPNRDLASAYVVHDWDFSGRRSHWRLELSPATEGSYPRRFSVDYVSSRKLRLSVNAIGYERIDSVSLYKEDELQGDIVVCKDIAGRLLK